MKIEEEEESVEAIRVTSRNLLLLNRKRQKNEETDVRRSLVNSQITKSDITAIVNKLKTKSSILASDLKLLQNALVDDAVIAETVLNTHGALRGLVRELTGHDVSKQCAASGCLCNLALGDSKTCCIIAKAAGAYLVAALDIFATQLTVNCAWTIGNLAGSGARAAGTLAAQGALARLCDVTRGAAGARGAALYALTHAAYVMRDDLRPEYLLKIIESLSKTDVDIDSSQLLFILSCHKDFNVQIVPEAYIQRIIEKLTASMKNHLTICNKGEAFDIAGTSEENSKCCELNFLIRILANLNDGNVYTHLANYFVSNNLVGYIKRLLETEVDKSMWWLLGNMMNSNRDLGVFFDQLTADL